MATSRGRLLALAFVLVGCGPTTHSGTTDAGAGGDGPKLDGDGAPLPHTLSVLAVNPPNAIVQVDLNATSTQDYTVTASYMDGTTEDVTTQVQWTVMNPAVGAFSGATLDIPAFAQAGAQSSLLTASLNGVDGIAQVTVVAYRQSGPSQDFFFILPYTDPNGPVDKPLEFSTNVPSLDVFFLMDTTGSMAGEISNLKSALTGTVVPGIKAAVADSQFGVGAQEDFPVDGYGGLGSDCSGENAYDQPFKLRQAITADTNLVQAGVNSLATSSGAPIGCGEDWPEGSLESIYQAATGNGLTGPSPTNVPANHNGVGGVQFRQGTMPIIVGISDADSHGVGETGNCLGANEAYDATVSAYAHTRQQTKDALGAICARYVGIAAIQPYGAACSPQGYMTDLATSSGARVPPTAWDVGGRPAGCAAGQCCTGTNGAGQTPDGNGLCPLVFDVSTNGTGVGANVATGVSLLARFASFDVPTDKQGVATDVDGNPLPAPHTTADFIKMITPTSFTKPAPPPVLPDPTFDSTTFHGVTPGTKVDFTVDAFNDFVPQTANAQFFKATIRVLAGGCTPLDSRTVLILVPPTPVTIQ